MLPWRFGGVDGGEEGVPEMMVLDDRGDDDALASPNDQSADHVSLFVDRRLIRSGPGALVPSRYLTPSALNILESERRFGLGR